MDYNSDIVIVGGGLNGCVLAIGLATVGIRSVVVDKMALKKLEEDSFDGRAYALSHATKRMLNVLNVWPHISEYAQPILDIKVSSGDTGKGVDPWFLHFDHAELEEGPMGFMIEDRYLRRALFAEIEASELITYISDTLVEKQEVENAKAVAFLSDGSTITASLLVACDGRNSSVAKRAGIERVGRDYDQIALVCALNHELPLNGTAHQFFTTAGPLAILPLPNNRCSIVWTETTKRAKEIVSMNEADYLNALRPVFGDFLGKIDICGGRHSYPLSLSLAQSFCSERLVLLGDAAHGIHPLAGQGLNLGLKDVAALVEVLALAKRRGENIGSIDVLQRYERWRRFDATSMAAATDGINTLFSNDNSAFGKLANFGLGVVNSSSTLRRGFMRHAAGLSGDLPRLLLGQKI